MGAKRSVKAQAFCLYSFAFPGVLSSLLYARVCEMIIYRANRWPAGKGISHNDLAFLICLRCEEMQVGDKMEIHSFEAGASPSIRRNE